MAAEAILETRSFYAQNPKILAAQSGDASVDTGLNSTLSSVDGTASEGNSTSPSANASASGADSASGTSAINLSGAAVPSMFLSGTSGLALAIVALGSVWLA